jgi:DNA sulfur modification protein DndE
MRFTKIRLTKDASNRLRFLAGRTGLTPNLLCRMGFCLSLEEPKIPNPSEFAEEEREFNRYTLLGEYDALYIALLRQRLHHEFGNLAWPTSAVCFGPPLGTLMLRVLGSAGA